MLTKGGRSRQRRLEALVMGLRKKLSSGIDCTGMPWRPSAARDHRTDRGDVSARQRPRDARLAPHRHQPAHLRRAGEGNGIDAAGFDAREQLEHRGILGRIRIASRARRSGRAAPQRCRNSISGRFGSWPYSCTPKLRPSRLKAIGSSAAMTPAVVGTSAAMSGFNPSSRRARAGFGPRVILRTLASCARNAGSQRRLMLLDAAQQPAQPLAREQDQIIAGTLRRSGG